MALTSLLVYVDNAASCAARVAAAAELARTYDAHLTGFYSIPELLIPTYAGVYMQMPVETLQAFEAEGMAAAERAKQTFQETTGRIGCRADWHCTRGDAVGQLNRHARYADLVAH